MEMIQRDHELSLRVQCKLLAVHRSRFYYRSRLDLKETELANELVDIYRQNPMYGYRRLTACLRRKGYQVNGKRVLRLMKEMGLKAIYPGPRTTIINKTAYKHPNLLKNKIVLSPHQAWQIDITYLRTQHGFMYLNALIDVYSRVVVGWTLNNTLEGEACLRSLEKAISCYGLPEIVHSDQGVQFTCWAWIQALHEKGIMISMSGGGRSNENAYIERLWRTLKYEAAYIQGCRSVGDLKRLLPRFMMWYNCQRPHQALHYQTPFEVLKVKQNKPDGYVGNLCNKLSTYPQGSTTTEFNIEKFS